MLWASDLHPLIHELLLPKSCLSSWEIFPTSCVSTFFFHPLTLHRLPLNLLVSSSLSFTSSCSILIFISQAPGCIFFSLHVTRLVSCSSWPSAFGVVWFVLLRFCSQRSSSFLCLAFSLSLSLLFIKFVRTEGACMWVCLCLSACLLLWIYPLELLSHTANTERLQGL